MIFHNFLKKKILNDGIFTLGNAKKDEFTEFEFFLILVAFIGANVYTVW